MLAKRTLLEELGDEYKLMLNKLNIADFTKCIAQYAGIHIQNVKDEVVKQYLVTWARNKKYIFDLFGDLKVDMPIEYTDNNKDYEEIFADIGKQFPVYYPWLKMFNKQTKNKIDSWDMTGENLSIISRVFTGYTLNGTSITHFFKNKLKAPDELVTAIGRVFENNTISATYTLSIDPVDIMLSSENPYNWTSCYRLEEFSESHADGCLAGVLDKSTIISYLWNNEGTFNLYDTYELKNIRYKKARITLAVNENFTAIHFNEVYPWKRNTTDDFRKLIRNKVEEFFSQKINKENLWRKSIYDDKLWADRRHDEYGYGEYNFDNVWVLKNEENIPQFQIYNEEILCPCGCGETYYGTQNCQYLLYNGEGHINENYFEEECEEEWCNYANDYVNCDHDCEHCPDYNRCNAVCSLDTSRGCYDRDLWEAEDEGDVDWFHSNIVECNPKHCQDCPLYKIHHPEIEEQENIQNESPIIINTNSNRIAYNPISIDTITTTTITQTPRGTINVNGETKIIESIQTDINGNTTIHFSDNTEITTPSYVLNEE